MYNLLLKILKAYLYLLFKRTFNKNYYNYLININKLNLKLLNTLVS